MDTRESFVAGVEVREGAAGEPSWLGGYAAVFNDETVIDAGVAKWRERISPSAFNDAVVNDDVIAAVNHDHKQLLGRSKAGTLRLSVDARGLRYDVKLPNTTLARDTVEQVRRGDLAGSSFKFVVPEGGLKVVEEARGDKLPLIEIRQVRLIDVGPVAFPAYAGTSVSARSMPQMVADALSAHVAQASIDARNRLRTRIAIERARAWAS
jgi:HK97 family phage prohead protease